MGVTNLTDKIIVNYTTVSIAFGEKENPLLMYWDVEWTERIYTSVSGELLHHEIYSLEPNAPKSYFFVRQHGLEDMPEGAHQEIAKAFPGIDPEVWWENMRSQHFVYAFETVESGFSGAVLIYGWNVDAGEHIVRNIVSIIRDVTFEDGSIWLNPLFDEWISKHEGMIAGHRP